MNKYEEVAHGEIKASADRWGLSVYPKVRVADVVDLDGLGVQGNLKRFGLQSHFDFLVCRDKWKPEYAVEFDGKYHARPIQIIRDRKKDALCERAQFPILRINSNHLSPEFGSMSLLAWLMDVYELQIAFDQAQRDGAIPDDEPFDPLMFIGNNFDRQRFPYWLSAEPLIRLRRLNEAGTIIDPVSQGLIGRDENGVLRGIEYIRISGTHGLFAQTAMRPQLFPVRISDLLEEILIVQLAARVDGWRMGTVVLCPLVDIYAVLDQMQSELQVVRAHSYGRRSEHA